MSNCHDSCADAPTPAAKIVCKQLHKWDDNVRSIPQESQEVIATAERAPLDSNPYECMDLACLCTYMGGNGRANSNTCILPNGRPLTKALRKEYRMLSDDERERFHAALRQLKESGEYDRISVIHSKFSEAGGAHAGPAFLPWHREYIKRLEIAIRLIDPTLALPYWDSVLDNNLPNPRDSNIWTPEFVGGTDAFHFVNNGPFSNWKTIEGNTNIERRVGEQAHDLFQESKLDYVMQQTRVENVLAFTINRRDCVRIPDVYYVLEYLHGDPHVFVGGDMFYAVTSANDPVFFLHHSFVDFIWESWRQKRQDRFERENAYPMDNQLCSTTHHFASAPMRPFQRWRNKDGLSNKYTDNLYEYAARPSCERGNCGSKYLFCDRSQGAPRCAAKIRAGGFCAGFVADEDPCHNGMCQSGICVAASLEPAPLPPPAFTTAPPTREICFNENECCATWSAKGECHRNPNYMMEHCQASCNQCRPAYDIRIECADRDQNCARWASNGECVKSRSEWMAENCRRSCAKCTPSRAQICGGEVEQERLALPQQNQTQKIAQAKKSATSSRCFNNNLCCQTWGLQDKCQRNPVFMSRNCPVSCGYCIPRDYFYGTCDNYHQDCAAWAKRGDCDTNPWMLENCRLSCMTCFNSLELREICRLSNRRNHNAFRVERDINDIDDFIEGIESRMPAISNKTITDFKP